MTQNDTSKVVDTNVANPPHVRPNAHSHPQGSQLATNLYAGSFSDGSDGGTGDYAFLQVGPDFYPAFFDNVGSIQWQSDLRLCSVNVGPDGPSSNYYFGSWLALGGEWAVNQTTDWNTLLMQMEENKDKTKLMDLDIHYVNQSLTYTGTWCGSPAEQTFANDLGLDDFWAKCQELASTGMLPKRIKAYQSGDSFRLTGLFERDTGGWFFTMSYWEDFKKSIDENSKFMKLIDYQVFDDLNNSTRWYLAVWKETTDKHQFIYDLDWGSFVDQVNTLAKSGLRLTKAVRYPSQIQVPSPQWDKVFDSALGTQAMGYAYCVLKNGLPVTKGYNNARAPQDTVQKWTPDTRINLASVSKSVTAVAMMKLMKDYGINLDDPFWPLVKTQFPVVGQDVDKVTIRNLLQMKSGMPSDPTLSGDIWIFLADYLQNDSDPTKRGQDPMVYSNTNFTILQAVIDCVTGHPGTSPDYYPTYVTLNVLEPMGIGNDEFAPAPGPKTSSTLYYSDSSDTRNGFYFEPFTAIAAGGWVASPVALSKFLTGVRNNRVIDASATGIMFANQLGWYTYNGVYGQYYHHNGGLNNGGQGCETGIIHLTDGYGCLLVANSLGQDVIGLMIQAFESQAS